MKAFVFFLLFLAHYGFAQNTIVKKDRSVLSADSVSLYQTKREIGYFVNGKENMLSYSDLDSALIGGKVLKKYHLKKKPRALFVIGSYNGKTLAVITKKIKRIRGGFESYVKQYEVLVIENNKVIETVHFTASKTKAEIAKREKFFTLATKNFSSCKEIMSRLELYKQEQDEHRLGILEYLDNPAYNFCK